MELIERGSVKAFARYTDAHIFIALDALHSRGRVSRKTLVEELNLGEGSVRSMLKVLTDWKWVKIDSKGIYLTATGKKTYDGFGMTFVDFHSKDYAVGDYQQGMVVRGVASKITNGMAERDIAVRSGAQGASVVIMREGRIIFPKSWDMDDNDPHFAAQVRGTGIKEGDALFIVGSDDPDSAKLSAAALGLAMK